MNEYRDESTGRFYKGFTPHNKGTGIPKEGDKECPVCHKTFHYKRAGANPPPKTCSKECRYKSCSITHTGGKNKNTIKYERSEKRKAQRFVQHAVKYGILIKERCKFCFNEETEAHHYKGYNHKNWLKVIWLCRKCHKKEHVRLRQTGEFLNLE